MLVQYGGFPVCMSEPSEECSAGVRREAQPRFEFCRGCARNHKNVVRCVANGGRQASNHCGKRWREAFVWEVPPLSITSAEDT